MDKEISELKPVLLWKNFWQFSQIPRLSKHEQQASKFLEKFGKNLGLDVVVDKVGNVLIRKPATIGYEKYPVVILQGHMDMVGQKVVNSNHDFTKDPIKLIVDGEWVRADGTTLGADNGIGVAATMAILQAQDIKHGPIEALFTIDEEVSSTGALAISSDLLQGKILLNMDGETEGQFTIGCAGRLTTCAKVKYSKVAMDNNILAFRLQVAGLQGGHSGFNIHLGRGNANQILGWILGDLVQKINLRLSSIQGGEAIGAIASKASAVVTVPQNQVNEFKQLLEKMVSTIKTELILVDPGLIITATITETPTFLLDRASQNNILNLIYTCPSGVFRMSDEMPGIVETSTNFSQIIFTDSTVEVLTNQRSFVDSQLLRIGSIIARIGKIAGAEVNQYDLLPGWKPEPNTTLVKYMKKKFSYMFGYDPKTLAFHVLLECGIFKGKYPDMEIVTFGPTIEHAHSSNERVNIPSVKKFWDFLILLLEGINEIKKD